MYFPHGFECDRNPKHYAGSKSIWYYNSVLEQKNSIEIDINYMYSNIEIDKKWKAPVLDVQELGAGKLIALFDRKVSRISSVPGITCSPDIA